MLKLVNTILIIFFLVSCAHRERKIFIEAQHNYSRFHIQHNLSQMPYVTIIYYDAVDMMIVDADTSFILGYFFPYAVINDTLYYDVLAINVYQCMAFNVPLTNVISHEYNHYKQKKRMGTLVMNECRLNPICKKAMEDEAENKSYSFPLIAFVTGIKLSKKMDLKPYYLKP